MRAMWIGTETAKALCLGNDFFDRRPGHVTPPGASFLLNNERLYGLWFIASNAHSQGMLLESCFQFGTPDDEGLRTFQGRAAFGAMKTTSYWLTVILATLIEAFIKDVLTFAASSDPRVQEVGGTRASLTSHQLASDAAGSIATPARAWARKWFQLHKAPQNWIDGFTELGVPGFSPGLADSLYELLGVRHLIVHSAGIVDDDYLRHHPRSPWPLESEVSIDDGLLRSFIQATFEFFAPIEAHFVDKYVRPMAFPESPAE